MASIRRRVLAIDDALNDVPTPAIAPSMARTTSVAAALAALMGALAVAAWILSDKPLDRELPEAVAVRVNAAVAFTALGVAWFVPRVARAVLASVALLIGVLTLAEYVFDTRPGLDELLAADPGGHYPGRISVLTATLIGLLAVGQLLHVAGQHRRAEALALVVLLVACLVLLGYGYNVSAFSEPHVVSRMALPTAAGLLLLSIAGLAAVPRGALGWAATGQDAGAQLVRRLLPLAVVGLPVLGYLCVLAGRHGWVANSATSALIVIVCATAVGVFTWMAARRLARVDRRRAQAIAELTDLRIDLERQVRQRADQLQRRHNEIAVLEDRQRIAADLHDIVIQRLFAAGMYLQSGAEGADDETRRRLDSAVEAMDVAIKDLRASIFELGGRVHQRIDMTTAVSDVCIESGRVLGFDPDVLIDDPDEESETYREDVLAVLREALANVARHAEAGAVDVVLRVGDGFVWLSVSDDGKGISETVRRSGTRNMAQRAKEYGGDCTWTRLQPRGTRVLWRVPMVSADVPAAALGKALGAL